MASGDKFYLADKATLDEVKGKIGSTTDTGGSSSEGSVFGKLNYLVSQVKENYITNIYSWSSSLMTRIGSNSDAANSATGASAHGKLNWFLNLFGKTDDSEGTATTGTVMGKLNRLISEALRLSRKFLKANVLAGATNLTVLSVSGAGEFYAVYGQLSNVTIVMDDVEYSIPNSEGQQGYFRGSLVNYMFRFYPNGSPIDSAMLLPVVSFKKSLIIKVSASTSTNANISYSIYE